MKRVFAVIKTYEIQIINAMTTKTKNPSRQDWVLNHHTSKGKTQKRSCVISMINFFTFCTKQILSLIFISTDSSWSEISPEIALNNKVVDACFGPWNLFYCMLWWTKKWTFPLRIKSLFRTYEIYLRARGEKKIEKQFFKTLT